MKKELENYYSRRAETYPDLDEPETIVACVRNTGINDHLKIISPKKEDRILDMGCGNGRFLKSFSICNAYGIDLTLNMLKRARGIAPLVRGDAEHLPFKDAAFDIVHSAGLLGVYKSKKIPEEAARVAKKNGRIFISFPAVQSVSGAFFKILTKLGYNPTLLDFWYTKEEIKKLFSDAKIIKIHRLGWELPFQRLYKNRKSEKLVKVFLFLERNLRSKPLFKYFGARFLVEARKL